jgi:RHS repeat-associated protein
MKNILKGLVIILILNVTTAWAVPPPPVGISGTAVLLPNTTTTYSVTVSGVLAPMWQIQTGCGTINSTSYSAGTYYATVTWTSTGLLEFYDEVEGAYFSKTISVVKSPIAANGERCGPGWLKLSATPVGGTKVRWYNAQTGGTLLQDSLTFTNTITTNNTYWIETVNTTVTPNVVSSRVQVTSTVNAVPGGPLSKTDGSRCGDGDVVVSAVPGSNASSIAWFNLAVDGLNLGTGLSFTKTLTTTKTLVKSVSTTLYAASFNTTTGCLSANKIPVIAEVKEKPNTSDIGQSGTYFGSGAVKLTAFMLPELMARQLDEPDVMIDTSVFEVRWYTSMTAALDVNATPVFKGVEYTTPMLSQSTPYYVRVKHKQSACYGDPVTRTAEIRPLISSASVRTDVLRVIGKKTESALTGIPDSAMSTSITYLDGLSRPRQQVAVKGSPNGNDVIAPIEYDAFGRSSKNFLPYVASTNNGSFHSGYAAEQASFYSASADKIADDTAPYAISVYESSPMGRILEQGSVGAAFQLSGGHTQKAEYLFNTDTDQVRKFDANGNSSGYYAANKLRKTKSIDAQGNHSITFTDGSSNTVLVRQQLDGVIAGTTTPYLETYYLYNSFGQNTYIISPAGVAEMKANSWTFSSMIKDSYCNRFNYDERGRVKEKKVPGQGWQYIVYDPLGRVVLTQDVMLRAENKWMFVKYDVKGRAVMTGLYTNTAQTTRAAMQTLLDGQYTSVTTWYEKQGTTDGYTNVSFPTTNTEVLSVNYFDDYDFDNNGTADVNYTTETITVEHTPTTITFGLVTGSKRKVMDGTATWLKTYVFYDDKGRVIQTRTDNPLNVGSAADRVTNVYADDGRVLYSKKYHNGGTGKQTTVVNEYKYNTGGTLLSIKQKNNTDAPREIVRYEYNALGQVVDKKLHNTTGTSYLQSVDYRYTIRGQLQSINNAELQADASNDETTDYFGMELLYNETDTETSLSTANRYDGNISAIKWKGIGAGQGTTNQRSYKYTYDKTGRLEAANSQVKGSTSWDKEVNALNEVMTYDHDGNIQKLQRKQGKRGLLSSDPLAVTPVTMDSLVYLYNTSDKNALLKVDDVNNAEGFKNGTNSGDDFTYDNSGNVISDKNKGMDSIKYNVFGKVVRIKFSSGKVIKYTYDAAGTKLTMKTYSGDTLKTTTEYANGFVYENNTLAFFGAPEGRVVNASGTLYHEYSIADHQGNTRVVFTSNTPAADEPLATFEGDTNDKSGEYVNGSLNIFSFSSANHTAGGSKVVRMNSTYKFGPAKSVRVYPGDKIDMEVWEYHEGSSGFGTSSPSLGTVITNVAGLFGGVNAGAGESGLIYEGFNDGLTVFGTGANQGDTRPAAYLNYVLFDNNYKVVDAGWQLAPATTFTKQKLSFPTKTIKDAGYIHVWLSYEDESTNWVYFDDFKVTHTKTNVIQYNEYYPFGLQTENSWTRSGSKNDYKYNAANELNANTGWYEMFYRGYDPTIGRMLQVDPYATMYASHTTYNYAVNNPVMINDPDGGQVKAPPGVSQMGWDRYQKLHERDNPTFLSDWDETFMTGGMIRWADQNAVQKGEMTTSQYLAKHGGYHAKRGQLITVSEVIAETGNPYKFQAGIWYQGGRFVSAEKLYKMGVGRKRNQNLIASRDGNGLQYPQEDDPSRKFYFISEEAMGYKVMLALQTVSHKEIVGILSVDQSGVTGILILPWAGNTYNWSDPHKGYYKNFYEDDNGRRYQPLSILHTHDDNDVQPSIADYRTAEAFKLPMYILTDQFYRSFYPNSSVRGNTYDLIKESNPTSLVPR